MKIAIAIRLANDPEFGHRVEETPMGLEENEHGTPKRLDCAREEAAIEETKRRCGIGADDRECDPYAIPPDFLATTIAIHLGKRVAECKM